MKKVKEVIFTVHILTYFSGIIILFLNLKEIFQCAQCFELQYFYFYQIGFQNFSENISKVCRTHRFFYKRDKAVAFGFHRLWIPHDSAVPGSIKNNRKINEFIMENFIMLLIFPSRKKPGISFSIIPVLMIHKPFNISINQ